MSRIAFIGTGGTIANEGSGLLDYLSYLSGGRVMPAPELLALAPDFAGLAEIVPVPYAARRSKEIGPQHWLELRRLAASVLDDPSIDGVIIGHGTGALEETAFFLHLTLNTSKPAAVIGSQRPPSTLASDAFKNLLDAIHWIRAEREAASPCGVVVIMDQTVHSARGVAKLANHTLGAMESPATGPLARINVDGSIARYARPLHPHTARSEFSTIDGDLPRVDVVFQYAGADATALDAHVAAGARGLVVIGFPPGTNTPEIDAAIERHAAAGIATVQASRAIRDPRVLRRPGLEHIVCNSDLSPQQARILLMLALARGLTSEEIQRAFEKY